MTTDNNLCVEVVYALPMQQILRKVCVPEGATAADAIVESGILELFPEINLNKSTIGIFSKILGVSGVESATLYSVRDNDRVEIYRSLQADSKELRRRRAENAKAK